MNDLAQPAPKSARSHLAEFCLLASLAATAVSLPVPSAQAADSPALLPTPKSLQMGQGEMPLTPASRIIAADAKLKPLAEIFSGEIRILANLKLTVAEDAPRPGDIVLKINPALRADQDILTVQNRQVTRTRDYAHTIAVDQQAVVEGFDCRAVCEGTATILQAIVLRDGRVFLPRMTVKDWPYADYTGIMIDCARQEQPIYVLKSAVEAARFWKVRYLHLHLTEDSAFTFPLKCYPQVGSHNDGSAKVYDLNELKVLVAYADARGVTLVPELEGPGHNTALQRDLPEVFGDASMRIMDIANDNIYPALEKIIGEMCEVFKSSPYFHIGGDEVEFAFFINRPATQEYMKKHNMREAEKGGKDDLLQNYVQHVNEIVKKNGKKAIFWGGWQGPPQVPALNDAIIYSWFRGAAEAQKAGFATITVPWEIKVPFPQWDIFSSNDVQLSRQDKVLGACRPMWEMSCETLACAWISGMAERQERTWGPDTKIVEPEFRKRQSVCDARMDKLVRPVRISVEGKVIDPPGGPDGIFYDGPLTVTLSSAVTGGRIRYTLDQTEPKANSPLYDKPLHLSESAMVRAALFDESGAIIGNISLSPRCYYVDRQQNLTTGKKVTTSVGHQENDKPENAVDGQVRIDKYWGCGTTPSWLQVDLEKAYTLDRVHIFPYWDGRRYYQYTIELSADGTKWTTVVDAGRNTRSETEKGRLYTFKPTPARYVRVNMLKNSDNYAVHLVELRVFAARP